MKPSFASLKLPSAISSQFAGRRKSMLASPINTENLMELNNINERFAKEEGLNERRFKSKMEKLRKIHERVEQREINGPRKTKTTEYFSIDENSSGGDRTPSHCNKLQSSQFLQDIARKSGKSRKMSNIEGILEKEFREIMGIESEQQLKSRESQKFGPQETVQALIREETLGDTSQRRSRKGSGPCYKLDLDLSNRTIKLENQEDQDISLSETSFEQNFSESSFIPTIKEITKQSIKDLRTVLKLRDLKAYRNKCIILPDDPWKVKWNVLLVVIILIASIVTPVRVAFYDTDDVEWSIIETLIDAVFFFDIVFSFFSAYYNKMEALISDRREIACGYIKSWFLIDVISIFPLALIANSTVNQLAKLARMPRIYKIIKTSKFIRLMKLAKVKTKVKKELARVSSENLETERLVTYIFIFFVLCHNLSCLWFLLAKLQDFETTWVARYDYIDSSMIEQYIAALYFIITTITTVGYGDITSKTSAEQLFCIGLMLLGVIAYSMAISSFMSAITASNERNKRLRWKLDVLSHIRSRYSVNFDLYWRLRQSLHYEHCTDMTDQQALLSELPVKLKVELSNLMYAQEIGDIAYFENKSPNFIATVAPLLKPIKITKGEYIYLKGDSIDGIYFIKKGESAYVQKRPKADLIFATNYEGSYFGDIDFTASDENIEAKRLFSVKAMTDMELYFLPKANLYDVDLDFKKEIFHLFHKSYAHRSKLQQMARKSGAWLRKKYDTFNGSNFGPVDDDDQQNSENFSSNSVQQISNAKAKLQLTRTLTLHKPAQIGKLLKSKIDSNGQFSNDSPKKLKRKKQNNKTTTKKSSIIKPSQVIEEEDRDSESQHTYSNSQFTLNKPESPSLNDYKDDRTPIPQLEGFIPLDEESATYREGPLITTSANSSARTSPFTAKVTFFD